VYVKAMMLIMALISLANVWRQLDLTMKKALREMQTLRAGCSKAEPKNFAPLQTPSRGRRTAKI